MNFRGHHFLWVWGTFFEVVLVVMTSLDPASLTKLWLKVLVLHHQVLHALKND